MGDSWRSVGAVTGWQTAASLCYYSVFAATTYLKGAFDLSNALVGVLVTATTLGYTLALVPSGAAVDGFGEKRVMLPGLAVLAAATVAVALAPTYGLLLAAGFLLGSAYATAMPASNRGIVASAPGGRENFAMGLKQVGVTAGSGAAALVVAGAAALVTWKWGFAAIAALAAGSLVLFLFTYEGRPGTGEWELPDVGRLRGNRPYVLLVAAGLFVGAALFSTVGYTLVYVDEAVGASPSVAGLVLAATQVSGSVGRVGAGSLADRLGGASGAATVVAGQAAVGALLFGLLALGTPSLPVAVVLFVGLGGSVLGLTGVFYSCLTELVATEDIGGATAGGQTALNAGALLAPPTFGWLADAAGYVAGWALLGGCTLAAVALVVAVRRRA